MSHILFIVDEKLKKEFFEKAQCYGGASYVLREMVKNYLSEDGFETARELKIKQMKLAKELTQELQK